MNKVYFYILVLLVLVLLLMSCEEKPTNSGVILDSLLYSTIQEAIDSAVDGDTIYLTQGTYEEDKDKNLTWDGDEKHITITLAPDANHAIIDCNGKGMAFVFNNTNQTSLDVVDGITIRKAESKVYKPGIYCEFVFPTIRNCTISDCGWVGIYCKHAHPVIENNTISKNEVGIMCDYQSQPTIILNIIEYNESEGIYSKNNSNPFVINNLIVKNKRGVYCWSASAEMVNNTIVDNEEWGIRLWYGESAIVKNSIIWGNGTCFEVWNNNVTVSYSCASEQISSINPAYKENIYEDPKFEDPLNNNYQLQQNSPCIDKGTLDIDDLELPEYDIDGNPRIVNKIDMGAYEWQW
ncbi:MAG: right-handed parallel beta-helix repeat-containing protein [Candidatus Cloacimonetes bacterium]|nr:right-handed parallel beta-helix repeat-containing protein [Candidatus Cloacimonadota bacterium]